MVPRPAASVLTRSLLKKQNLRLCLYLGNPNPRFNETPCGLCVHHRWRGAALHTHLTGKVSAVKESGVGSENGGEANRSWCITRENEFSAPRGARGKCTLGGTTLHRGEQTVKAGPLCFSLGGKVHLLAPV